MSDSYTLHDALGMGALLVGIGGVALVGGWIFRKWDKIALAKAEARSENLLKARWDQQIADDAAFRAIAKRLPATVVFSAHCGRYNLRPLLKLTLRIEAPEGAYDVDLEYAPEPQYAHHYGEGGKIHVYVDPNHREHVKCAAWDPDEDA